MPLPKKDKTYTLADLMTWDSEDRYELIDGVPYLMSPGPAQNHQEISVELTIQLGTYLRGKTCKVFSAPFDVRLFERQGDRPENVRTVVQPDLFVVCDPEKLDGKGCKGAPDLIIEILSPSSHNRDWLTKFNLYAKAGVREYWIVNPNDKVIQTFLLENGYYVPTSIGRAGDRLKVNVLEDCFIDLSLVFPGE